MERNDLVRSIQERTERIELRLKNIDNLYAEVKNEIITLRSEVLVLTTKKEKKNAKTRRP